LEKLVKFVDDPEAEEAKVYATTELASVTLRLNQPGEARKLLNEAETALEKFDYVEKEVHASFYRVSADYWSSKSNYTLYYRNSLLYLACIDEADLTRDERHARAYNLSIAALVSDEIYNFGELLLHPILDVLQAPSSDSWLRDLIFVFNRGDIKGFDRLSNNLNKHPELAANKAMLHQKIALAALTEAVFKRPPHDRAMTFKAITQATGVKKNEVEFLLMKALSLELLKGKIDQVNQIAKITWVQPKVLEKSQIEGMRQRLKEWDNNVNDLGHYIEGVGKDVWAS
jgi:26S proteasome regulatory subunit N9